MRVCGAPVGGGSQLWALLGTHLLCSPDDQDRLHKHEHGQDHIEGHCTVGVPAPSRHEWRRSGVSRGAQRSPLTAQLSPLTAELPRTRPSSPTEEGHQKTESDKDHYHDVDEIDIVLLDLPLQVVVKASVPGCLDGDRQGEKARGIQGGGTLTCSWLLTVTAQRLDQAARTPWLSGSCSMRDASPARAAVAP